MSVRNSPCPCGSGLKFKKCCLPKQLAEQLQKERYIRMYTEPCKCGSGKKYGKCCMGKLESERPVEGFSGYSGETVVSATPETMVMHSSETGQTGPQG